MSDRRSWNVLLSYPAVRYPDVKCRRTERPPFPSSCEISAPPGYSDQLHPDAPGWKELCIKGDRQRVQGVGTPLPDDTECARLSGSTPSGFPKKTCGVLSYLNSLKEKHTALLNISLEWEYFLSGYVVRIIDFRRHPIRIPCQDIFYSLHSGFSYGKGLQSFGSSCF